MFKFVIIALNLLTAASFAASELYAENEEIKQALNNNMYEPNYFSLFFGLFVVISLVYITSYVYQKLIKVKINQDDTDIYKIDILSTTSLGQNKSLHIIKANGKCMLIGATQNNITFIKDIEDTTGIIDEQNSQN